MAIKFLNTLTVDTDVLYVDASSNSVGIGTTSPGAKLTVVDDILLTGSSPSLTLTDATSSFVITTNTAGEGIIKTVADKNIRFFRNDSVETMRISATTGNVGIGTTSPAANLQVFGSTGVRFGNASGTGMLFADGGSTRIGSYTNHKLYLVTNNTARATIDTSGNVGIGTTNPQRKFHVNGIARIEANGQTLDLVGTDHSYIGFYPDGTAAGRKAYIGFPGSTINRLTISNEFDDDISFFTNGSEKVTIENTGDVGIGTTSPAQKLHVIGNSEITGDIFLGRYIFHNDDNDTWLGFPLADTISFRTSGSDRMYITSTGNVGIGTTSPSSKLQVNGDLTVGDDSTVGSFINVIAAGTSQDAGIRFGSESNTDSKAAIYTNTSNSDLHFDVTETTRILIDSATGNVGIGTTSPGHKLDVSGTGRFTSTLYTNSSLTSSVGIIGKSQANGWGARYDSNNANYSGFYFDANNDASMILRDDAGNMNVYLRSDSTSYLNGGNVGIGTTSPTEKLQVNGNVKISNGGLAVENSTSHGYVALPGGAFYHSSSGSETGAIKITLPTHGTADMLSFVVDVFDYTTNESFSLNIKGYLYQTTGNNEWVNVSAQTIASNINRNFTIRFGADGSNNCVWIGETNSSWSYPQIQVRDFTAGFSADIDSFIDGWDVDIVTSFDTVDETYFSPFPMSKEVYGSGIHLRGSGNSYFNGGNVGIGTTSPAYTLDVNGTLHSSNITLADGIYHEGDTNTYINFLTDQIQMATAGSVRAYINSLGNVGIGTTSPASQLGSTKVLDISSTGNGEIILDHTDAGVSSDIGLYSWNRNNDHLAHIKASCDGTTDSAFISFHTQATGGSFTNAASNEKMRITSSGYVGIGTTSPSSPFHVQKTLSGGQVMTYFDGAAGSGAYGAVNVRVDNINYGTGMRFYRSGTYDSGAVGFINGTSTVGSININTSSTSYNTTSDYRLKENLTEITDGIDRIKQLKPKRFNFIGDTEIVDGFIAHEAKQVVPEAVTGEKDEVLPNGDPVYQGIDQSKIVPLLTAALQEAITKIEILENRLQTLENK